MERMHNIYSEERQWLTLDCILIISFHRVWISSNNETMLRWTICCGLVYQDRVLPHESYITFHFWSFLSMYMFVLWNRQISSWFLSHLNFFNVWFFIHNDWSLKYQMFSITISVSFMFRFAFLSIKIKVFSKGPGNDLKCLECPGNLLLMNVK